MTDLGSKQIAAISRLFSSGVIREMAKKGKSPLFARLAHQSLLLDSLDATQCVYDLFEVAFSLLNKEGYRHEYIYKSALAHKILLGKHSLHTASILNEFRVGECKADIAILNGTSTVYEVKSERDSLTRLERQIAAYAQVFAKVYIIAGENHIETIRRAVPKDVGIMRLNGRHQISTIQDAADLPERTSPAVIFDSIRTSEAQIILKSSGVPVPNVPNTELNRELRKLFVKLEPRAAHAAMVKVLKQTRNLSPLSSLIEQLPLSLQTAALLGTFRKMDHSRLIAAVNTRLQDAAEWA